MHTYALVTHTGIASLFNKIIKSVKIFCRDMISSLVKSNNLLEKALVHMVTAY